MGSQDVNEGIPSIRACPECYASQIFTRLVMTPRYRCSMCGHEFEEPFMRPRGAGPSRGNWDDRE